VRAPKIATGSCPIVPGSKVGGNGVELVRTCQPYMELEHPDITATKATRNIDKNTCDCFMSVMQEQAQSLHDGRHESARRNRQQRTRSLLQDTFAMASTERIKESVSSLGGQDDETGLDR